MPRLVFATWLFLSLDTYGLLDADYEATSTVALGFGCCARIARRLRGRYPVVVESERARRPPWASADSGHYTVARGEAPRAARSSTSRSRRASRADRTRWRPYERCTGGGDDFGPRTGLRRCLTASMGTAPPVVDYPERAAYPDPRRERPLMSTRLARTAPPVPRSLRSAATTARGMSRPGSGLGPGPPGGADPRMVCEPFDHAQPRYPLGAKLVASITALMSPWARQVGP